jgi:S-DNA-T family DNA segregation ATPase FtsK/SpoIIIE
MKEVLDFQAERIEMVLASHKIPARVIGGQVTPRLVRYHLSTPLGVQVMKVARLSEELALSLGAPTCRVYRDGGTIQVEIPRTDAQVVPLLHLCQRLAERRQAARTDWRPGAGGQAALSLHGEHRRTRVPPVTAVLGLDTEGVPLLLRLPSPNVAHVLVAGTTGSGKTALARTMVASLAIYNGQRDLQLILVDPKGRGLVPFEGLPHLVAPVVTRVEDALEMLARVVAEMERRDLEGRSEPRLVVVLDELADLIQVGGREMEGWVTRLTQRGREAGIHLVACTQKPVASVIGSLVKSNFPVRLVGRVASPEDAKVAAGLAGTGAERLLGEGDFLVVAQGQVTRVQAAYVGEGDVRKLVAEIRKGTGPLLMPATGTDGATSGKSRKAARLRPHLRPRLYRAK